MNRHSATTEVWYRIVLVLCVIAAAVVCYWPAVQSLQPYWTDTDVLTYTHGYLVALLSLGLILRDRKRIAAAPLHPQPLAALAVLLMGLIWLVLYNAGIQVGYLLLLPVLLWGALFAVFGWGVARLCLFPLGYLYLAIPVWNFINSTVQWGTVFAVRSMLRVVGIPAHFDERFVQIPSGTFEIAGGCSGLNFMIVALALAILLGELRRDSLGTRIKLVALAIRLALISNWLRVFVIILAGHLTNMQHYLVRVSHEGFGWCVFGAMMAVFFLLARRIGEEPPSVPAVEAAVSPPTRKLRNAALVVMIALAVPAGWRIMGAAQAARPPDGRLIPKPPAGWSTIDVAAGDWQPKFENADHTAWGGYARGDQSVETFTAVYFQQRQGKELRGYNNSVTGEFLKITASGQNEVSGKPFVELNVTDTSGRSWLLWYSFAIDERWFSDAVRAQLWYGIQSLTGPQLSRALMLRSACGQDCDRARQTLKTFIEQGVLE